MGTATQPDYITPSEYLLGESDRSDGIRYEYVNGKVYAMAGASRNHNRLCGKLFNRLFNHLEGSPCEVFQSDMKVGISTQDERYFYYPDIQVSCEEENDQYYNRSPCLIIEVLSTSTARTDRTEKLHAYQQIPSLQEYLLCSQDSPSIERHRRDNDWSTEYFSGGDIITLRSVGMELQVDDIYEFLITKST